MATEVKVCSDCNGPNFEVSLECSIHKICQSCLSKRGKCCPLNVMKCDHCIKRSVPLTYSKVLKSDKKVTTPENCENNNEENPEMGPSPGIWIYVDDSNIWIEAKKLQSKKKKLKTMEDPRIRIDVGKLADAVADGRVIRKGVLYGSEPPPVDTVWDKIREKKFKVICKHRSQYTGREKQVDTQLAVDITAHAKRTDECDRSTIVLISGDADVIPALEKVLEENRWTVEVHTWKHAMAQSLKVFASKHKTRVEIKELNLIDEKIVYKEMKFHFSLSKDKQKVEAGGIVLEIAENAFPHQIPSEYWCDQLEDITKWPFQYYWFELYGKKTNDLVIVFYQNEKEKPDLAEFLKHIQSDIHKSTCSLHNVKKVRTFLEFYTGTIDHRKQSYDVPCEKMGQYNKEDEDTSFESVCRGNKKRHQLYSDPCQYKTRCRSGSKCKYKHTEEEKSYFRQRTDTDWNPKRKTQPCRWFSEGKCSHKKAEYCDYAHGDEDAWCWTCKCFGHFIHNCHKS